MVLGLSRVQCKNVKKAVRGGRNLRISGSAVDESSKASDPLAAIRSLSALATQQSSGFLVLVDFHRFLQSAEMVQALAGQLASGKQNRTFILILSPVVYIPSQLEKLFVVIERPPPDRQELQEIAQSVATGDGIATQTARRRLLAQSR